MKHVLVSLMLVFLAIFGVGCGGGTSGTGDPSPRVLITGNVVLQDGTPISSGNVAAVENGDNADIAADGTFILYTTALTDSLELLVSTDIVQGRVVVQGLGKDDSKVAITIVVDQGRGSVTISEVDISLGGNPTVTKSPELQIVGTVENEDGRGVSDVFVELAKTSVDDTTDNRGYFQFIPVKARAGIELVVRPNGEGQRLRVQINGLPTDKSSTANVRLRLKGLQNGSGSPVDGFVSVEVAAVSVF